MRKKEKKRETSRKRQTLRDGEMKSCKGCWDRELTVNCKLKEWLSKGIWDSMLLWEE